MRRMAIRAYGRSLKTQVRHLTVKAVTIGLVAFSVASSAAFRRFQSLAVAAWLQHLVGTVTATRAVIKDNYKYLAFRIPESRETIAAKRCKEQVKPTPPNEPVRFFAQSVKWNFKGRPVMARIKKLTTIAT